MSELWNNLFSLDISVVEKMLRPTLVYLFLLVGLRLAGKRELAQLNAMDLIVLLTLSNTVQNSIIGPDNTVSGGVIGATTLLAVNYFVVRFLFGHPTIDRWVEGAPVKLIDAGHLQRGAMRRELVTRNELAAAAHKQGFPRLEQIQEATLEPSGVISFVGKEPPSGELHHAEVLERLDQIARQLDETRKLIAARG